MNVEIITTKSFRTEAKKLIKKFPSLKKELFDLEQSLQSNPRIGTPLANHCFKIRLAIKSKGKDKSGGARVITHLITALHTDRVYLLTFYDKSEFASISDKHLKWLIQELS